MCEQCCAATKTYGEVLPRWWLIQATKEGNMMKVGDFGLVQCNDPDYIWPVSLVPRKDPAWGMTDEQFDNMTNEQGAAWDEFQLYIEELEKHFLSDPLTGWCLVDSAKEAGWDREKDVFLVGWLSHQMAVVIEGNPTADEAIGDEKDKIAEATWGYIRDEQGTLRKNHG